MQTSKLVPVLAVILSVVLFSAQYLSLLSPAAKPVSAPADEFSAQRAYGLMQSVLAEGVPHPIGSAQNKIVKQRIIEQLVKLDIHYQQQQTWACASKRNSCAFVENIIARIPGTSEGPAVALMAHYDSVPMAAGAGDDMSGVVAILESARALKEQAPFRHPILLIFTDGEEMGLLGAEGFFQQHPMASDIRVVLDYEGSGSSGPSMVLRTTEQNELLIGTLSEHTSRLFGYSFANEIFKRMPNDTDFSVVDRAGIAGIDFAFAGERNHYHTPNDNIENIDLRTIQHHGENMLPLARALANSDLDELGGRLVYGGVYGIWVQWISHYSVFLLISSALLLCFAMVRLRTSISAVLFGLPLALAVLLSTAIMGFAAFRALDYVVGTTVSWPANPTSYRLTLFFSVITGGLMMVAVANKYLKQSVFMLSVWWLWLFLSLGLVIYMPDAANTLVLPLVVSSAVIAIGSIMPAATIPWIFLVTLVASLPMTLGVVLPLEQSQGYRLIVATLPLIGLFMMALAPLLHGARLTKTVIASAVATILSITWAALSPLYSDFRPQHVNIHYLEDVDAGAAHYYLISPNPIRDELQSIMNFDPNERAIMPFSESTLADWATGEASAWAPPISEVVNTTTDGSLRKVSVTLHSQRQANSLRLLMPAQAKLTQFQIEGRSFTPVLQTSGDYANQYLISLMGIYDRKVELTLTFDHPQPVTAFLMDVSTTLPAQGNILLEARRGDMSPVHRGDQAVLFREVTL